MNNQEKQFEDDVKRIRKWYEDEERYPLSESLMGRLQRWKAAYDYILVQQPLTDTFVVKYLVQNYPVSEPQAWRDVRDCKKFFAQNDTAHQEFERIMLVADIRDTRTKAKFAGDNKTVAQCNATLAKMGVGKAPEKEEVSKTIILEISFNPKLIGAKDNPNLLAEVEKYIGEAAARELMVDTDEI